MYRFFDLCIDSELALPGLPGCGDRLLAWSIAIPPGGIDDRGMEPYHTWKDPDGRPVMSGARRGADYLLDFFGLARYFIDFAARRIDIQPSPACPDSTLAHLLLDQVLPRVVCHEGRLVLHASAVALADGGAVAFSGVSGRGKSTLASAFHRAGYRVLSDDCLLLERRGAGVAAVAAYASMRLWSDSADALFTGEQQGRLRASPMAHYTNKKVFRPDARQPAAAAVPMPLKALYLLEPPGPLHIVEAGGMAAVMTLVEAQFALDVADREAVRRGFAAVQRIAGRVPVFRLAYPREFRLLPGVIEAVEAAVSAPIAARTDEG